MTGGRRHHHALTAIVLAACLPLAACGGDDTGDSAAGTPGGSAPAPVPAAADTSAGTSAAAVATAYPETDDSAATSSATAELPRGGTELFPRYRLVGYVGHPESAPMGRLGIGDLDASIAEIETKLAGYAGDREIQPVAELIVSIAHPVPGPDGSYRTQAPEEMIQTHLDAARRHGAILLLNIQTGAVDFLPEVQSFEKWLVEPDVGIALDPEWAVEPGQVPGQSYGRTSGQELDDVATYLADLVAEHHLPEKAMVYHQVDPSVVQDEAALQPHDGVAIIKSADGIGDREDKVYAYDKVNATTAPFVHGGFKLFLEEDLQHGPLMTPEQVAELDPEVDYLMVE